jgi:cation diffusion facilitator CzcD-associated flavoprotein CzcO
MTDTAHSAEDGSFDVIVVGAGFSGLYALHRLRKDGLRVRVLEQAGGVGGTWWWNRYPGARVDFPGGPVYCYTFSEEIVQGWNWEETQPDQPAVLGYLNYVADTLDLRRDIQLETRVEKAVFDESSGRWCVSTSDGETLTAQFLIGALGTLSAPYRPDIPGLDDFAGEVFHTGNWPQDRELDFTGRRVGVIGTGSSAVQAIPELARQAANLTVFQRTPQYTLPARNRPLDPEVASHYRDNWPQIRTEMLEARRGLPPAYTGPPAVKSALDATPEERRAVYEDGWQNGGGRLMSSFTDLLTSAEANETLGEFVREKIREIVHDPAVAEKLIPNYLIGTKRTILDSGYYETYNRENVTLVDLRADPIETITPTGVRTRDGEHPLDVLVLATGYAAITGALLALNPVGRDGRALADEWRDGHRTHLGLAVNGFPNLFIVHGPQSPSVLYNMPMGAERQVDWIADCIQFVRTHDLDTVEADVEAQSAWGERVDELANQTLYPRTDSWYMGSNIPGKPRQFAIHLDGPGFYELLAESARHDYKGFTVGHSPDGPEE